MSKELAQDVLDQLVQNCVQAKLDYLDALRNRNYAATTPRAMTFQTHVKALAKFTGWSLAKTSQHVSNMTKDKDAENPS